MAEEKKVNTHSKYPRIRAEKSIRKSPLIDDISKLTKEDLHSLGHQLQVHQPEIELKNKELGGTYRLTTPPAWANGCDRYLGKYFRY